MSKIFKPYKGIVKDIFAKIAQRSSITEPELLAQMKLSSLEEKAFAYRVINNLCQRGLIYSWWSNKDSAIRLAAYSFGSYNEKDS
jgi:hypothetical protein